MGLISDLLGAIGGKKAPRTIETVEAALARLGSERTAAREAVARAMRDRDELLLVDETDKKIAELDAEADRHRLTLERCDKAEPLLLRELEELRSAAKRRRWAELRSAYDEASIDFANSVRVAVGKMTTLLSLNEQARREGYEAETRAAFVPPMRMISIETLNEYETAIEKTREMGKPAPPPASTVVAPTPIKPNAAPKQAAKPTPAPPPVASKPLPKPPFVPQPDADGNVKIVVVRPGLELEGRAQARAGERLALPAAQATAIVRSGNAEFEGALR